MNQQYEQLKVRPGEYIPQPAMDYPQDNPFARTLFPKYTKQLTIDEHYPFIDDSPLYRFNLLWGYYLVVHLLLRLKLRVQMGLRICGRDVLRKHKEGLKNGAITIANHVYRLDCPCVLIAVKGVHTTRIPMFCNSFIAVGLSSLITSATVIIPRYSSSKAKNNGVFPCDENLAASDSTSLVILTLF